MFHSMLLSQSIFFTYLMLAALIHPFFVMLIDREKILQTTLSQIMAESDEGLTKPLRVIFMNEEAIDEGGVRKELFQLLVSQLFSLEFGKQNPSEYMLLGSDRMITTRHVIFL